MFSTTVTFVDMTPVLTCGYYSLQHSPRCMKKRTLSWATMSSVPHGYTSTSSARRAPPFRSWLASLQRYRQSCLIKTNVVIVMLSCVSFERRQTIMIQTSWQIFSEFTSDASRLNSLFVMIIYVRNAIPLRFMWSSSTPKIRSRLRVLLKSLRRQESNWIYRQGIWSPGCRTLNSASTQSTTNTSSEREEQMVSEGMRCFFYPNNSWWNSHARRLIRLPHESALQLPLRTRFSSPYRLFGM